MSMTKQIQIAIAAALLIAVSAPAFAESQRCMNKIGVCDKGEQRIGAGSLRDQGRRCADRGRGRTGYGTAGHLRADDRVGRQPISSDQRPARKQMRAGRFVFQGTAMPWPALRRVSLLRKG